MVTSCVEDGKLSSVSEELLDRLRKEKGITVRQKTRMLIDSGAASLQEADMGGAGTGARANLAFEDDSVDNRGEPKMHLRDLWLRFGQK